MVMVKVIEMEPGKAYKDTKEVDGKFKILTSKEEVMAITTSRADPQYKLVFDDGTTIRNIWDDKYEAAPSGGKRKSRRSQKSRRSRKSKKTIKKRRKSNNRRR
jgi:hypothetical protein